MNENELKELFSCLNKKNLIFLPINNNNDLSIANGGSHWSLLIFKRNSNNNNNNKDNNDELIHIDSIPHSSNINVVKNNKYLDKLNFMLDANIKDITITFPLQKQINSYDCGIHLLIETCQYLSLYLSSSNINDNISPSEMRNDIKKLVIEYKKSIKL